MVGDTDVADRVAGCLLGLAIGDAIGEPYEGKPSSHIPRLRVLSLGVTTDDTALARNLAQSLCARGAFDRADLMRRHMRWFGQGAYGAGRLTRRVLRRVQAGEHAEEVAEAIWRLAPGAFAGNGSVMYCAPLGVAYASRPGDLQVLAPRLSALTHYDPRCQTAVLATTTAVAAAIRGHDGQAAVEEALRAAGNREGAGELRGLIETVGKTRAADGADAGYSLLTAAIGLQALRRRTSFQTAVRAALLLGGDTDTNCAVAGALVGARVGEGRLPHLLVSQLREARDIRTEARCLTPLALIRPRSFGAAE